MIFVGRKKEITAILKSLEKGENVILTGHYGMGRTSLIRHISQLAQDKWHFVFTDFSQTAKVICAASLSELGGGRLELQSLNFKSVRGRLGRFDSSDARHTILVMDNIAKLTPQKYNLIRYLKMQNRFQFIAITEPFLKLHELDKLRGQLLPAQFIRLSYLNRNDSVELVACLCRACGTEANREAIAFLAASTHGYPLGIHNTFQSKRPR
jgi:energy-coupling factor transporter ATP-binding protein EcfA2